MKIKNREKLLEIVLGVLLIFGIFMYENHFNKFDENIQMRKENDTKQVINLSENSKLKIYFIDVGQADCILIDNNQEYALIDAGNNNDGKKIVEFLNSLGVNNFKYVIGTHAHEDHIGGMDDIIKNFSIEHFFMPDVITTTKTYEDVLDALEEKKLKYETPEIDSTFSLAETKFKVIYIGKDKEDLNDTSIVLKATYGDTSYLFTGDATNKVEKEILNKDLKSDVLKVGHHGSQYSTHAQFLKKINPKYAIIQVGKNNSYSHPKDVTIRKLEKIGAKIYRTDLDSTILLSSDGKNITFETMKTDTNGD